MTNGVDAPPPPRTSGCFGKGCLTLAGLLVFLAIALVAGTFWGLHYLRSYSATERLPLPTVNTVAAEAPDAVDNQPVEVPPDDNSTPTPPPATLLSPEEAKQLERDWKAFEKAAVQRKAVSIELTAVDINTLIAGSEARDEVSVSIENNIGRLRFSVPLNRVFLMDGRYLNGEATVAASPDGDPAKARISNILLNGQSVPDSVLDQGLFGWPSINTFVKDWLRKQQIASFRIENNKVIGETRGDR